MKVGDKIYCIENLSNSDTKKLNFTFVNKENHTYEIIGINIKYPIYYVSTEENVMPFGKFGFSEESMKRYFFNYVTTSQIKIKKT